MVDHGTDISRTVHECEKLKLHKGGEISGDKTGTFELKSGTPYIRITIDGQVYNGVMIQMTDEAGNDTMCFSAVGNNNETVWGVHYY
jgi:arabinan endo-1,5-alpha-L-arabinosidase